MCFFLTHFPKLQSRWIWILEICHHIPFPPGKISNAHAVHCDRGSVDDPKPIELAKQHSIAVDYPKTGELSCFQSNVRMVAFKFFKVFTRTSNRAKTREDVPNLSTDRHPLKMKLFGLMTVVTYAGVPENFAKELKVYEYPDWMEKPDKPCYKSTSVVGNCYRICRSLAAVCL